MIVAALAAQALVVLLSMADGPIALRLPIGLVYALAVPGFAVVGLLRLSDPTTETTLSIVLSIVLGIAVSQVAAWFGVYSLALTLGVLSAITSPCLFLQLRDADLPATRSRVQWTRSRWT